MLNLLLIFLGSGIGGITRYGFSNSIYYLLGREFPYGTLLVNITGSFLMGFAFTFLLERFDGYGPMLRSLLLVGFLGGYTTFSAFSIETVNLLEGGRFLMAGLNILSSVLVCLSATWLGLILGRQL